MCGHWISAIYPGGARIWNGLGLQGLGDLLELGSQRDLELDNLVCVCPVSSHKTGHGLERPTFSLNSYIGISGGSFYLFRSKLFVSRAAQLRLMGRGSGNFCFFPRINLLKIKNIIMKNKKKKKKNKKKRILFLSIGVFSLILMIGTIQFTSHSGFCSSCHYMEPFYKSWKTSSHSDVECSTCHYAPGIRSKIKMKFDIVFLIFSLTLQPLILPLTNLMQVCILPKGG